MGKCLCLAFTLLFLYGCTSSVKEQKGILTYFDLKGYFEKEAARLKRNKPVLTKTVMVNGAAETKKISIADWPKELAVFSDADINRSAWAGLFSVEKDSQKELYTSANEKVPVKEVRILKKDNKLYGIQIFVKNANVLYSSSDTLSYYPDSLYQVKKKQHIKLLTEKNYSITGKFK
ncbi:hypothetical protein [Pedobacter heparinus]|uniref:hypothetical protein n=1 Tax=Pedobacter heparinus TaxID=984 RepID=UPI0029307688|nr:hypothetical protein [Pedobacter heparinus]